MSILDRFFKRKKREFHNVFEQTMETEIDKNKVYIEEEDEEDNDYAFLEGINGEEFARRYCMELTILIEQVNPKYIQQIVIGYEKSGEDGMIRTGMKYDDQYVCLSDQFLNSYAVKLLAKGTLFKEEEIEEIMLQIKRGLEAIDWNAYYPMKKNAIIIKKRQ